MGSHGSGGSLTLSHRRFGSPRFNPDTVGADGDILATLPRADLCVCASRTSRPRASCPSVPPTLRADGIERLRPG